MSKYYKTVDESDCWGDLLKYPLRNNLIQF